MKLINKYRALPAQARASFWFLICAFFQKAISSITTPIFTRLLTTAEYGKYSVFSSWLNILTIIISLNIWGGIYMQGMVKFDNERDELSSSLQGLNFVLVIVWTLIYVCFNQFWNDVFSLNTYQMFALLILVWTSSVFNFWSNAQRVDFQYRNLVIVTVLVSVFKPVIGVILIKNYQDKVTARVMGLAIVEICAYTGCFISQVKKGKVFYSKKYWLYALKFSVPLLPHYLSMSILSGADRIMISNMRGDSEAGIYSLAYSISLIMTMFNSALLQTVEPWIYKKIKEKKIEDISKVAYMCFIIIATLNILLIIFAPEIVMIFAPPSYYNAIWVIPSVAMSVFFMFTYTFFATFEFYYEKKGYLVLATLAGALLNIILNYIYIGRFGFYAAGYTTLFCYIVYSILHYCFMRKICRVNFNNIQPYSLKILLAISLLFVTMGILLMFTYDYRIIRYCILIIIIISMVCGRNRIVALVRQLVK